MTLLSFKNKWFYSLIIAEVSNLLNKRGRWEVSKQTKLCPGSMDLTSLWAWESPKEAINIEYACTCLSEIKIRLKSKNLELKMGKENR